MKPIPCENPAAPEPESDLEAGGDSGVEVRSAEVAMADHGERLDRWLVGLAGEFSRSHLQTLIRDGHVRLGGAQGTALTTPARRVAAGQRISVTLMPTAESQAFRPEPMALDIRFEDEHLIVLHKQAGLVVHPAAGNWSGTLLNGLLAHHPGAARLARAGIVHRLDKDTSGLMVVAKTLEAQTALTRLIAQREVRREYCALVEGQPRPDAFSIEVPIGRDPVSRVRMAVVSEASGGRSARTDVTRVATTAGLSAVLCKLHTGRTHQIRVHLASRGHPLVGDAIYGGHPALGVTRQALHAWRLSFTHPRTGQWLSLQADLPPDLRTAWQAVTGRDRVQDGA